MDRLVISLTRPSRVGLFLKDKIYIPIIYVSCFFALCLGIFAVRCFNTNYLLEASDLAKSLVLNSSKNPDVAFDGNKMSGSVFEMSNDSVYFSFNNSKYYRSLTALSYNFQSDYVEVSVGLFSKRINYSELNNENKFSLLNVKQGNTYDKVYFTSFISEVSKLANPMYSARIYLIDCLFYLVMYLITLFIIVVFVYMINPLIGLGVRVKLGLYDSLIYFPFFMFSLFTNIDYFRYGGMLLALIYAYLTFSHIVKVRVTTPKE